MPRIHVVLVVLVGAGIKGVISRHTLPTLPPDPNGGCPYQERPAGDVYCNYWCSLGNGRYAEGRYRDGLSCQYDSRTQGECYGGYCQHPESIRLYKADSAPADKPPQPEVPSTADDQPSRQPEGNDDNAHLSPPEDHNLDQPGGGNQEPPKEENPTPPQPSLEQEGPSSGVNGPDITAPKEADREEPPSETNGDGTADIGGGDESEEF